MALSADTREQARKTREEEDVPYPLGHSLDTRETVERIGCYFDEDPLHLRPTGFVLTPDRRVSLATYSSGKIGRLGARDTADLVESMKGK